MHDLTEEGRKQGKPRVRRQWLNAETLGGNKPVGLCEHEYRGGVGCIVCDPNERARQSMLERGID